jgi:hypothetical protein
MLELADDAIRYPTREGDVHLKKRALPRHWSDRKSERLIELTGKSGETVSQRSSRSQQGRFTLMANSQTPKAPSGNRAPRLWVKTRARLAPERRAGGESHRPRIALIETGLFVLVVSTAWAVASVSVWWVPAYLTLLAVIFVSPRNRRTLGSASEAGAANVAVAVVEFGPGLRVDSAEQLCSVGRSDSGLSPGEWPESPDANPDPAALGAAKQQRRGRGRVRKVDKQASLPVTEAVPVTWILAGPGRYVRAEGGSPAVGSAEDVQDTGSNTGDHGIAPAALSLAPESGALVEELERDPLGDVDQPKFESAVRSEAPRQVMPIHADSEPHVGQSEISKRRVVPVGRGVIRAQLHASRVSWRHGIRSASRPPDLIGTRFAHNVAQREGPRRSFGRVLRVEGNLRTRSPPGCMYWQTGPISLVGKSPCCNLVKRSTLHRRN